MVFKNTSDLIGDTVPHRRIKGASTTLNEPAALWLDASSDALYVASRVSDAILVFNDAGVAFGNVAPSRTIAGAATTLDNPNAIWLDAAADRLYVLNSGSAPNSGAILVEELNTPVPPDRQAQAGAAAAVLGGAPDEARAHHLLGLLAERRGEARQADRHLVRARRLDPEGFPRPVALPRRDFDAAVERAFEALPEPVRRYLANVPITVEDLPDDHDLLDADPPLPPTILGLFRGAPYGQKLSADPWSHLPSSIVLYQRNLERAASSRAGLEKEIATTLVHEVGHFLGLDEDELWARGLD
jgi:predicted Zn-dependent protease with MMP-like domain